MQFAVIAYDGTDKNAPARRLSARQAHIALGDRMKAEGQMLYGAAILNEAGAMVGSILICNFSSRRELDGWLAIEPYVVGKVWETIEIKPCRVGPSFAPAR